MKVVYRGCKETGLKEMIPRMVNHGIPYVYATTDVLEAVIYSVKGGNFNYTNIYGYDENGRCLIERKKDSLNEIYNVPGRYYILDGSTFFKHSELGVGENEYVSKENVKVIEEVEIPNVLNFFKKNGLKIYYYPDRPKEYPKDDSDLIECAILTYTQLNDIKVFDMLLKYHPELSDRVQKVIENIVNKNNDEIIKNIKFFK